MMDIVELSRLQFAITALYHFLFVPLTIGLSVLLGLMETVYVMTGRTIWRDMTKFWGALFGINFAMGVATGITMEFQFGTNWAYYSHYVGDVFGTPLALEGLMAFFLEATFVGLFFFGWNRLSKIGHLIVTWLVAVGTNFSALWILIANGWMQFPVGARFNAETMRMEVTDFMEVMFNPVAQAKFVHTVSAGYVTGSVFVLAISAWYLLRGRHVALARRSMTIAASFGLASALSVVVLGDESGYTAGQNQKMKIAAIEAMWQTEPAPASFTAFGLPNVAQRRTEFEIKVPWMLGLIATRSIDKPVPGIEELVGIARQRIRSGMIAYDALDKLHSDRSNAQLRAMLDAHAADLGYALLLKRQRPDVQNATDDEIARAAELDHSQCAGAVLGVPPDGRRRLLAHRAVCAVLLSLRAAPARRVSPLSVGGLSQPAAAVARRRARLDRRGIWPPALGGRRRAADVPRSVGHRCRQCAVQPDRFRHLLFGAADRRCLSAAQNTSASAPTRRLGTLPQSEAA